MSLAALFLQTSGYGVGTLFAGVVNYAYYILFALIALCILLAAFAVLLVLQATTG